MIISDLEKDECFDSECTNEEDDNNNNGEIGGEIHSPNKNNKVQDVKIADLKEQPNSLKREVSEEDA